MRLKKIKDLSILESERLVLKPLSKSFLSMEYVNWMNDPKVIRFIESGGNYNIKKLEKNYFGEVANRYEIQDNSLEFGFISSVTEPFCNDCTRIRLSSEGVIYLSIFFKWF